MIWQRPSLDVIRAFIKSKWGLNSQPVIFAMKKARNVFVRISNEDDFKKAMAREVCNVDGKFYRIFHQNPEFRQEVEPSIISMQVKLPRLPPNFYKDTYLEYIVAPLEKFIRSDNATKCATKIDGARCCIQTDVEKASLEAIWIGNPKSPSSILQEVIYENLPAYCQRCQMQCHNEKTCKWKIGKKSMRDSKKTQEYNVEGFGLENQAEKEIDKGKEDMEIGNLEKRTRNQLGNLQI